MISNKMKTVFVLFVISISLSILGAIAVNIVDIFFVRGAAYAISSIVAVPFSLLEIVIVFWMIRYESIDRAALESCGKGARGLVAFSRVMTGSKSRKVFAVFFFVYAAYRLFLCATNIFFIARFADNGIENIFIVNSYTSNLVNNISSALRLTAIGLFMLPSKGRAPAAPTLEHDAQTSLDWRA